ncbi:MAG: YqgE/AlgH family protein [Verrucomicrobiota bacterium]
MDFEDPSQLRLAGSLILADPSLREATFRRTVLLLTTHTPAEGAHGYILNRPIGKTVGDFLNDEEFASLRNVPIFMGGPVNSEQLTFSSIRWDHGSGEFDYEIHLNAGEAKQRLLEGFTVRAFVGYAGWSEGQLEHELQQRAWITHKPESVVLRNEKIDDLWSDLLRSISPWHRLLADAPEDPSLN